MGHFLRGGKWATFETGKLLRHIAFPNFKQCLFRWTEQTRRRKPPHSPPCFQCVNTAQLPAQICSLGMLRKGLFLHPSKAISLGYGKLLHHKELQYLGRVDLGGECSHPA